MRTRFLSIFVYPGYLPSHTQISALSGIPGAVVHVLCHLNNVGTTSPTLTRALRVLPPWGKLDPLCSRQALFADTPLLTRLLSMQVTEFPVSGHLEYFYAFQNGNRRGRNNLTGVRVVCKWGDIDLV